MLNREWYELAERSENEQWMKDEVAIAEILAHIEDSLFDKRKSREARMPGYLFSEPSFTCR